MQNWGLCTDFTDKRGIKVTEHSEELHAGQDKVNALQGVVVKLLMPEFSP